LYSLYVSFSTKQTQNRYFTPTTEEEREEWGEQVHEQQRKNLARQYIDAVRRRKGQFVDAKVVVHAEKQRTRKTG
jgi:ribosome assembly protein 1